jgi:hypothetical protein
MWTLTLIWNIQGAEHAYTTSAADLPVRQLQMGKDVCTQKWIVWALGTGSRSVQSVAVKK